MIENNLNTNTEGIGTNILLVISESNFFFLFNRKPGGDRFRITASYLKITITITYMFINMLMKT